MVFAFIACISQLLIIAVSSNCVRVSEPTAYFRQLTMAKKLTANAVIKYFSGEEGSEVFCEGSDDDLGMSDEESDYDEPDFQPFEIDDDGGTV